MINLKEKIIDLKYGINFHIERIHSYPGLPNLYLYLSQGKSVKNEKDKYIIRHFSDGVGVSPVKEIAINRAIGESIERYCSSFINTKDIHYNLSFYDIKNKNKAINPKRFQHYTEEQYINENLPFKYIKENTKIDWVKAFSLSDNASKLVPADLVYCPYLDMGQFRENITNGLACGPNLKDAILNALLELIERDSIMITWKSSLSMPVFDNNEIINKSYNQYLIDMMNQCTEANLDVIFIDITLDLEIPVVFCILKNKLNQSPYFSCGASCKLNVFDAMQKSLEEALIGFSMFYTAENIPNKIDEINTIEDHLFYYAAGNDLKNIEFLYSSSIKADIDNKLKYTSYSLGEIVKMLKDKGIEILYKELTTDDIKLLNLNVVRVVSPELVFIDFKYPGFNNKRLYEVPKILKKSSIIKLNKLPHPFP